jgi:hypothetical protein
MPLEGVNIADLSKHVRSASEKRKHARLMSFFVTYGDHKVGGST